MMCKQWHVGHQHQFLAFYHAVEEPVMFLLEHFACKGLNMSNNDIVTYSMDDVSWSSQTS